MELQGKKVLVLGSGKSGIGASDLLAKVGAFTVIYGSFKPRSADRSSTCKEFL